MPPLQRQHLLPGFRQVSSVHQPVVAAADHNRVIVLRHSQNSEVIPQCEEKTMRLEDSLFY
jgi:hypothetical protein